MALRLPKRRRTRMISALLLAFVLISLFLLAVPFMPERIKTVLMPPKVHPPTAWYVALGDSYTAAPALEKQLAVSTPSECFQSDSNYPHIVARAIKAESLTDVSCSGAFTRHLEQPQWTKVGSNAPQADALSAKTKLVTIGLSGNDTELFPLFFECAGKPKDPANPSFCTSKFRSGDEDRFAAAVRATMPAIGGMLDVVKERAPNAAVYVVGYPQIAPHNGTDCPNEMPFTAADLAYLDSGMRLLNAELKKAAAIRAMHYVDTYAPSPRLGVCAPRDRRWVESVVPTEPAFAMHPNPVGEQGMAEAVLKAIERVQRRR
jgi:hypothetical protein